MAAEETTMPRRRATSYDIKLGHIRDTAGGLFARDGFTRTSMAELAGACGVSKALLYHYFDSKEALLFDILRVYLTDLETAIRIDPALASSPRDHLRDLIWSLLQQYREAGNTHKLLTFELTVLNEERQVELRNAERRIIALFSSALDEAEITFDLRKISLADVYYTGSGKLADLLQKAIFNKTNIDAKLSTFGGTSDGRFIAKYCPVVEFGLVGRTMHQVDEKIGIDEFFLLTEIYLEFIDNYFNS